MRFSSVFSVLACGAMALAAAVSPNVLVSRSNAEISAVAFTLDAKLDTIFPPFGTCRDANCTQEFVLEIAKAIDVAKASTVGLVGLITPDISNEIAKAVIDISLALSDHKTACNGKCGDLSVYAKVNVSLSLWLKQLELCIPGILDTVKPLVTSVIKLLAGLGLTSVYKLLL